MILRIYHCLTLHHCFVLAIFVIKVVTATQLLTHHSLSLTDIVAKLCCCVTGCLMILRLFFFPAQTLCAL